jgi:large subunit ribosomal protein L5
MADEKNDPQVEPVAGENVQAAETAPKDEKVEAAPKAEKADAPAKAEKPAKAPKGETAYSPRLRRDYDDRIVAAMTERFGYKNRMQVPRLDKIVINMGVGDATQDKKRVETAAAEM